MSKARAPKTKPRKRAPRAPKVQPDEDEIDRIYDRLGELDDAVDQIGKMLIDLTASVAMLGSLVKKNSK